METEVDAPEEHRLSHPYQLSAFPLMTVDQSETNLRVLGLVNEEYAISVSSGTEHKHSARPIISEDPHFRSCDYK